MSGRQEGGASIRSTEGLYGSEGTFYDTVIMDTRHNTFTQTHRMYSVKREPRCQLCNSDDYEVSARFTHCNSCTISEGC